MSVNSNTSLPNRLVESQQQSHPGPQRFAVNSDPAAVHRATVEEGVAVVEGFLSPGQVQKLNGDVTAPLDAFCKQPKSAAPDAKRPWMADFVSEHVSRAHNLVGFSHVFRHEIPKHEFMHEICRQTLLASGDYWLRYVAVIENGPGTSEQKWHRGQPDCGSVK
ncbi:uncharacterized protein MAM_06132 [Metarhizium album ARSEF 1941]|uniref:Phytanoyl-CoA dioxygenase family protein n=1 Tax=Metarhizium album (strain ARSEF 1941) TaxID=1081103 RepID=A0A0B2WRA2_METAS|nr:uncharacterized protein MAM_06132 [Metarhizium album ARSEF 1941]KHN96027.1 hypothetical protein MAM_06132 [Metarhizium album ARSEF 1941]